MQGVVLELVVFAAVLLWYLELRWSWQPLTSVEDG